MYWLDGFTFDDNLINNSFLSADSNGEISDNNHRLSSGNANSSFRSSNRKAQNLKGLAATTKAKRRRHAHYKLNSRLDRKSSRGMIYENEELRLRTININAEVERGQTDIKRLRKENEQLRREIWTLRDECDRLNKRVKAKFIEHEQGVYSVRCSGGNGCSCQCNDVAEGCEGTHCRCNSEDSDSCDSCCCHEENAASCSEECCVDNKKLADIAEDAQRSTVVVKNDTAATDVSSTGATKLTTFDHLSVVSEETLSNSEVVLAQQNEHILNYTPDICGSQTTLPSLVRPVTPLTPVELVANELNDLQAVVPPLSYFENILQHHMNSNYGSTPDSSSTTNSGKTIGKHTNGWDYKLESPFVQRQYQTNSISPILTKRLPAQTLTTFVPATTGTSATSTDTANSNEKPTLPKKPTDLSFNSQQHPIIETVTITTLPPNSCGPQGAAATLSGDKNANTTPRHFFAPLKPKLKLNTNLANQKRLPPPLPPATVPVSEVQSLMPQHKCEPPDLYVANALATPYRPPNKPTVQPPPIPQRMSSTSTMQAQTDSANLESILNDIEAISEDILAIQLVKTKSRENIDNRSTDSNNKSGQLPLHQDNKNTKPYRSEMNLLLTYEGDNPTIKQAETAADTENSITPDTANNTNIARRTRSLERDHTDSPSPHIPDPMQPFPENRKYIGFDRINKVAIMATTTTPFVAATATQTSPILNSPVSRRAHLPLSPLVTNVNSPKSVNGKQLPPTPPIRSYPAPLNIKCAGIARSSSVNSCLPSADSSTNSAVMSSVAPNKSQLYAALANAAAKKAQFRSQPTHMTRSLDMECKTPDIVNDDDKNVLNDETETLEKSNRKATRISAVCADTDSPESTEMPSSAMRIQDDYQPSTSGSCTDLHTVIPNPALRNLKQTSQSTPNSPHSSRKHENSPLATTPVLPIISITANTTPQHQCNSSNASGMSQLLAHNHAHSNSYPNVVSSLSQQQKVRKSSQDAIKASAAEIACAAANAVRSKCSRRHSDSTVSHGNQRVSGVSGGTNGTHHHHLHNHHHRQHSSSLASNANPHQSHHSRRDSNQDTVASFSDRNSNSLASSRESSASFSMRSQRRKLSISSHTGGKIPWCGCWGNGCL